MIGFLWEVEYVGFPLSRQACRDGCTRVQILLTLNISHSKYTVWHRPNSADGSDLVAFLTISYVYRMSDPSPIDYLVHSARPRRVYSSVSFTPGAYHELSTVLSSVLPRLSGYDLRIAKKPPAQMTA